MRREFTGIWREAVPSFELPDSSTRLAVIVPLVGIFLSESLVYSGRLEVALWIHLLMLLYCTATPLVLVDDARVLRAFALVPVFRLVNLGVPVFFELTLLWLPLVYGPLLPGLYLVSYRQSPDSLSVEAWKGLLFVLPLALVSSLFIAGIEYRIIRPAPLVPAWDLLNVVTLSLVMIGFVGLVEELLFRGILQRTLVERLGGVTGLVVAAIVFGLMHSAFGHPQEIGFAVALGLVLGIIYALTDNLAIVTFVHGSTNVFLFGLFPIHGPFL